MAQDIENEIRRKFMVFEEIAREEPGGAEAFRLFDQVIRAGLASQNLSTLRKIERELDAMAEEAFVRSSLRKYRDKYWGHSTPTLLEKEVWAALLDGRIRDEDQMRVISVYLDQIATGARVNVLGEAETEQLRTLILGFTSDE